ncbi:hypothetical protein TTHERM_00317240 (macronuclear) [Tetrahymena thermophila SB210]|uniref:Uncharacterized protein n=1 Tax=Tetrahymena thermophila (strain SB210) TaxID=312017 RepID=I7M995_TETTS|nr:hypothetical protein TTHERM_00317240 [Tetrahymena thermophila SB210]EAS01160.2 hypothetical protein TTHERM_00317240 [Tetrahymena thermophila SB210]|eukprot:XP_001021405.2 hypothetical protein TTHERM_00317240 [Tetrahymena thermophila SB210]
MQKRVNFQDAQLSTFKWVEEINKNRAQSVSYGTNRKKIQLKNDQIINNLQKSCNWNVINAQNSQTFQQMQANSTPLPATNHSQRYKKIQSTLSSYIADSQLEQQTTRPNTGNASRSFKLNLSQLGSTIRSSSLGAGGGFSSRYKDWNCLTKAIPTADFTNDFTDQNKNIFDNQINLYDPTIKVKEFVQVNRLVTQSPRSSPRITETECYSKDRGYTQISRYSDNLSNNQISKYTEEVQNMKNNLIQKLKTNCDRSFEAEQQYHYTAEKVYRPKTQQNYSPNSSYSLAKQSIGFALQKQYNQKLQQSQQYDIENINSSYTVSFRNSRNFEIDKQNKAKTSSSPQNKVYNNFLIKKRSTSTVRGSLNS